MRLSHLAIITALTTAGAAATAQTPSKSFEDCQNCPEMVSVPSGSFMMGTSVAEELRQGLPKTQTGRSTPVHKVTFKRGFAMAKYPVTIAQFRDFINESGYTASDSCVTQYNSEGHKVYEEVRGYSWRSPGFPQDDRHPVVCVSGEDAEAYAAWLSKKTGRNYEVPNEAQFEYALRAGTNAEFVWGTNDRSPVACEYSNQPDFAQADAMGDVPRGEWYRYQCNDGYAYTSPVGNYKPNRWGLYDLQGNVWEWTSDCWNDSYKGAPTDGSTWRTGDCDARSSRGGSYGNAPFSSYAGIRAPRHVGYVGHSWGFRVVRND